MRRSSTPWWLRLSVLAAAGITVSGCVTKGTHDRVVAERDELAAESRDLAGQVERLTAANQGLSQERVALIDELEDYRLSKGELEVRVRNLQRREAELAKNLESSRALLAEREAEIDSLRGTYDGLVADLENEVAQGQIQIEQLRSGLQMNLPDNVLFASGSAALDAKGADVLRKVARRLLELPHDIEVRGHTDNVPIGSRYPSNWELAAARASSVVRLLAAEGIDPTRLYAVSRGEFEPVDSNDTPEGRAHNRRIEIRLEHVPAAIEPAEGTADGESAEVPGPDASP